MRSFVFLAAVAALFLAGCSVQPSASIGSGVYKGQLKNTKLRQSTKTVITLKGNEAVVEFGDLMEKGKACKATFSMVNTQIAGTTSFKGSFDGAIGVCRVFTQDPSMERKLHLRHMGKEVEVIFSWDSLAREHIIVGYLK